MPRATVVGAGMTKFGPHDKSLTELFAEAALPAMADAGVSNEDVDELFLGNTIGLGSENEMHLGPKTASYIGIPGTPATRFEDACATSAAGFKHAVRSVESGVNDVVLVGGVERCTPATGLETPEMTELFAGAADRYFEQPVGVTFPGIFALLTKRHMHEFGTTEEHLAEIAVKNHRHGSMNPRAHFGGDKTVEEVLDSPIVADPFRLLDCCPFSDGAAAVVVVREDLADCFDGEPVDVTGIGHATDVVPLADKVDLRMTQAARDASSRAYDQAGVTAADLDLVEVHDCFTGAEVLATEAIGIVEEGEAGPAAAAGRTAIGGDVPVNPSGGLKAKGHPIGATGAAQIVELTEQLRGEAGERQVESPTVGGAHNLGGDAATTVFTVMEARS